MIVTGKAWARALVVCLGGLGVLLASGTWGLGLPNVGAQTEGAELVQRGGRFFQQTCSGCHTVGGGATVAPDLLGVTERRQNSWLKTHIKTPSVHHDQNDPISVANRQQFGLAMPTLPMTDQDVDALIAYLAVAQPAPLVLPSLYLPTLAASVLAMIALTVVAFRAAAKRVEVRP